MRVLEIINGEWAIMPDKLNEIHSIYAARAANTPLDVEAIEAAISKPLQNKKTEYQVLDGVAVLPLAGVLAKRANLFSQISGATSYDVFANCLAQAENDPTVHSILISIDSPGGAVDGVTNTTEAVRKAAKTKKVVAVVDGMMGSAAYWIGSAASEVWLGSKTCTVGSIGVVTAHQDVSAAQEKAGVRTTELTAGKYKRIDSQYAPLSEEGKQVIQGRLDYIYSMFVDDVAQNRGVSTEKVLADMADGRVFIGQQAIDAGLADGFKTQQELVAELSAVKSKPRTGSRAQQPGATMSLTKEEIERDHPEAAAALREDGATAERARIQAIEEHALPGYEAMVAKLKFDGKSTAGDVACAILKEEKARTAQAAQDAQSDAPPPVKTTPAAEDKASSDDSKAAMVAKARQYMADTGEKDFVAAYKAVGGK